MYSIPGRNWGARRALLILAAVVFAATIGGCASQPDKLAAQHVSEARYVDWSCKQLADEATAIDRRVGELYAQLKKKADNDTAQAAIGAVLFWPALFLLEGGDGPQAMEYTRLKGERETITRVARLRQCDGIPPVEEPTRVQKDVLAELEDLKRRYDNGFLSDEEYQAQRSALLEQL